ncbi:ABC transporter ATP-binding protein [Devosia sp.]|uniref:ABC transporter ATP-binding protein n=1 Tax=Devosia sp. TaxID=1871048 RepID=UPI003BA9AB62
MARLSLAGVSKVFGSVAAVSPLSLDIGDGELVCLLGPSGSGKSTLLRMIGGFELPSSGQVLIDGQDVASVRPNKRPTAMVFQSHALWTHMNVFDNVAFGLKLRKMSRGDITRKVMEALALVGLEGYDKRMPRQLSGGQQQRVAIARCLVLEPKILLMDEPFASLDQHLRERLREEVRLIQRKLGITTLFVTHAQDEALALADRIVVMSMGAIEQVGTPDEIYANPESTFVANFIGTMNMVKGAVAGGKIAAGAFTHDAPIADGEAILGIRPEDFEIADTGTELVVKRVVNLGPFLLAEGAHADGTAITVHLDKSNPVREGSVLRVKPKRYAVYRDGAPPYRSL